MSIEHHPDQNPLDQGIQEHSMRPDASQVSDAQAAFRAPEIVPEVTEAVDPGTTREIGSAGISGALNVEPPQTSVDKLNRGDDERERRNAIDDLSGLFQTVERTMMSSGPQNPDEGRDMHFLRLGQSISENHDRSNRPTTAGLLAKAITSGRISTPDIARQAKSNLLNHFDDMLLKGKSVDEREKSELVDLRDQFELFVQSGERVDPGAFMNEANRIMRGDVDRIFNDQEATPAVKAALAMRALHTSGIVGRDPAGGGFMRANFQELIEKVV